MPFRKHKPEEIIGKLREAEIVLTQGASAAEAWADRGQRTDILWRKEYGGLKTDQARWMKNLEKENGRLRAGRQPISGQTMALNLSRRRSGNRSRRSA